MYLTCAADGQWAPAAEVLDREDGITKSALDRVYPQIKGWPTAERKSLLPDGRVLDVVAELAGWLWGGACKSRVEIVGLDASPSRQSGPIEA